MTLWNYQEIKDARFQIPVTVTATDFQRSHRIIKMTPIDRFPAHFCSKYHLPMTLSDL